MNSQNKKKLVINPLTGGLYFDKQFRKNPTENEPNELNPLFRPIPSKLSLEDKYKTVLSIGIECVKEDELHTLLAKNQFFYAYDGFEPSGRMHIAQGILKAINVNKMIDAGGIFIFWVADWFALLNNKMQGDLEKIKVVGEYFIEIWKAVGMKMSNVKFLWASDSINSRPNEYWLKVLDIARKNNLNRIKKCAQIMGREESDNMPVAQMFYPCMQCTDIFFLDIDICQLGNDQRKVNMLAREYAKEGKSPIVLSSPMVCGLLEGQDKMSKSDPNSAIFMEDSTDDIKRKIKKAFCPPNEIKGNAVIEFVKYFVFLHCGKFHIKRLEKYGGDLHYDSFDTFCDDYQKGLIDPNDVKTNLAEYLDKLIEPVRKHFKEDPHARKIGELVKVYQKENEEAKKKEAKNEKKSE